MIRFAEGNGFETWTTVRERGIEVTAEQTALVEKKAAYARYFRGETDVKKPRVGPKASVTPTAAEEDSEDSISEPAQNVCFGRSLASRLNEKPDLGTPMREREESEFEPSKNK